MLKTTQNLFFLFRFLSIENYCTINEIRKEYTKQFSKPIRYEKLLYIVRNLERFGIIEVKRELNKKKSIKYFIKLK